MKKMGNKLSYNAFLNYYRGPSVYIRFGDMWMTRPTMWVLGYTEQKLRQMCKQGDIRVAK